MKITDALELFILDCQSRRLTKSTITFYELKVGRFIRWLSDSNVNTLEGVTSVLIKRYLVYLQDQGMTDHSQHDYVRAARTFFNYCLRDELIDKSPFAKVKMPKIADDIPIVLTDSEIAQALQRVKLQRNRLIIRFILDSGVRASELLRLNVDDVDMTTGIVTVKLGKQQKSRFTSVGSLTRKEFKRYLMSRRSSNPTDPLLVSEGGGNNRLRYSGIMSVFRLMQHESRVDNLTAHTLRRTMATKSLDSGMDAYLLARMLGHGDLQMLQRYIRLNKKPVIAASEQHSVVDNLTREP